VHTPVRLRDDVVRDTESPGVPSSGDLTSDESVESDRLGNQDPRSLLELGHPFTRLLRPDVDVVALLALESGGVLSRDLNGLQIVVELDFLVEGLLLRVVAVEQLRFWR